MPVADLQLQCEVAAESAPVAEPRRLSAVPFVERTVDLPGSARLLGAQWLDDVKRLIVFDAADSRVLELDSSGRTVRSVGRAGDGPDEFRLSPVYLGSRQKMRLGTDDRLFVLDDRFGHAFLGTRQVQEVHFGSRPPGLPTDAHVARTRDGWLISLGARFSVDSSARCCVELYFASDTGHSRSEARPIGTIVNPAVIDAAASSEAADHPYSRLFRRTWDATESQLAIVSNRRFALCFSSSAQVVSWGAWSLAAKQREVDTRERDRILRERFGRSSGVAPMMDVPVEEIYRNRWPELAPFYHDIVALDDLAFAAFRLDGAGGTTVDLFRVGAGYSGSVALPASRAVLGGYSRGLLLLDSDNAKVELWQVPHPDS